MKLLLYCTKAKPYLYETRTIFENSPIEFQLLYGKPKYPDEPLFGSLVLYGEKLNGKVVGECDFEVEKIKLKQTHHDFYLFTKLLEESCLCEDELFKYLDNKSGYAIHIKNLKIFDELMGLSEYNKKIEYKKCDNCEEHCKFYYSKNTMSGETNTGCTRYYRLPKAPQNMCYCYDASGNKYVLISIQPQWLCKILNGKKTIEIRKKVLKEML